MNDLTAFARWVQDNPAAPFALEAAGALLAEMQTAAPAQPALTRFTGILMADRAIGDAYAIGAIAGQFHVEVDQILTAVRYLLQVTRALL